MTAHPLNFRAHPRHQRAALDGLLTQVGWVQNVIVNERSGRIIDGHLRVALAIQREQPVVPVVYVDLSDDEEALLLASLDPVAALAQTEADQLAVLLDRVSTDNTALQELFAGLAEQAGLYQQNDGPDDDEGGIAGIEQASADLPGVAAFKQDVAFASTAPFGIPELLPQRLADLPGDLTLWAGDDLADRNGAGPWLCNYSTSARRLDWSRAVLGFYTDDARFESLWLRPDAFAAKLVNTGPLAVIAPNWSLWPGQAQAVHIWSTYRSRWVARYFQEAGIAVIPDLNWSGPEDYEFCFAGVPIGAPLVSIQVQTFNPRFVDEVDRVRAGIRAALAATRPARVLFYASKAGRELVAAMELATPTLVLPTLMDVRREALRERKGATMRVYDRGFGGGGGGGGRGGGGQSAGRGGLRGLIRRAAAGVRNRLRGG